MDDMHAKIYLLDTSVLIEASDKCYNPDFATVFWKRLAEQSKKGTVRSIDKVKNEIGAWNKFLTDWTKNEFVRWEDTNNNDTLSAYHDLIKWSEKHSQFNDDAKDEFERQENADSWLVAHAITMNYSVVTEEVYNAEIKNTIHIPNVCNEFNVNCINTVDMLRELHMKID